MRLASRLHSGSLARCQRETGARQFVKWLTFFQEEDRKEVERTEKWEYYAARIAALICSANGVKTDEKSMVMKFFVEGAGKSQPEAPVTKEQRTREAKAFWGAFFKMHDAVSKKPVPKKRSPKCSS